MAAPNPENVAASTTPTQPPGIGAATPGEAVQVSTSPLSPTAAAEPPVEPAPATDPLRGDGDPWGAPAARRASSTPGERVFRHRKWHGTEEPQGAPAAQSATAAPESAPAAAASSTPKTTSFAINTRDETRRKLDLGKAISGKADLSHFPSSAEAAATARAEATEVAMASILQMVASLQETITELKKEKEAALDKTGVDDKLPTVHHKDLDKPGKYDGKECRVGVIRLRIP